MPEFSKASISMGFNFWDDEDAPNDLNETAPNDSDDYDDDLADAESNADEDTSHIPPSHIDTPGSTFQPINGLSTRDTVSATPEASTPAPNNTITTAPLDQDAAFVMSDAELDDEDDSGASEAEIRLRGDGETFVKQRRITADLDMTDQMIVNLKNANHPNEYIASELRKHGLVPYDTKTVGSRYIRLQRKIAEREAQRLEDELTDWHDDEDEALLRADELAQNEIKDIIQRAKARRWQIVSRNLHKILKKELKYGPKQCEKRFVDLMDDCPTIPIEMDDNPEERRAERATRVLEKMNERAVVEAREKSLKEQKRLQADQTALRVAMEKSKRAQDRAERAVRKAEAAKAKALMQNQKHMSLEMKRQAEEAQVIATSKKYAEKHGLAYVAPLSDTTPSPITTQISSKVPVPMPTPTAAKRKRKTAMDPEIADSPRSRMSVKELGDHLSKRGLSKSGTKAEQIKRLATNDENLSPSTLRSKLKAYGVNTEGSRHQMIARLISCEVSASAWGKKHAGSLGKKPSGSPETVAANKRAKVDPIAGDDADDADDESEEEVQENTIETPAEAAVVEQM